ncbi:hypothetical protein INT45_006945 [Circinella minor]|uniref:RING-type domain-containing protein n=1 Tax=Circinella minor TaxID=1195481 RepID=A0A8H7S3Y7_9FUNG|nr:hypothetical protein INT45_006945 [Circinella minor]
MPRFWTRVLHSFRHNNKKRHSTFKHSHSPVDHTSNNSNEATTTDLSFDSSLSTCLTESKIYQDDLVKLDMLEHALQNNIDAFFCTWNEELERIYEKCRWALDSLTCSIQELSYEICNITSPFQNPDQQSLSDVHQFISEYLKKWKVQHQRNDENNYNNNNSTKELLLKRMKFSFDLYLESLQSKGLAIKDPRLSHCIQQICQWEHDFFLFKQYFQSQMTILWNTILNQDTIQRLLQTRWKRRYNQCINITQTLEDRMKTLLEQSSPAREDFICAICLSVLSEPVTITSCLHTFCRPCIQHFYCTCTLSSCPSTCHKASRRQRPEQYYEFSNTSTTLKGKHHQQQQKRLLSRRIYSTYFPHKRHSSILYSKKKQKLLACQCYPSDELEDTFPLPTKPHTCPLCRSLFTLKNCIINVALDNFISLYFSYEEKVDDDNVNNNMTTTKRKTMTFDRSHGDKSGEQQQNQKGRRSVIYNAIHQPFLWLSSPPSSLNRQQQSTTRNSTHLLASSSSQQNENNNITNESILRSRQHQQRTTVDTRLESFEEYDNVNRDLHNLARRSSWWF